MPELFPTFDMPDIVVPEDASSPSYGTSFLFDFSTGDFVRDGAGRVITAEPYQAWSQWCAKAAITERSAYLVYTNQFGTEVDEATKQPTRQAVESELERTITEALMVDPRTASVTQFVFTWSGEECDVSFVATPTVGTPQKVEVTFGG